MKHPSGSPGAEAMRPQALWSCLGVAGLLLLTGLYLCLSQVFPFDLAWDMDLISVHDALLLNSGELPLHTDHPKYLMHLLTAWALRAGYAMGWISVADLAGLARCPAPMLCVAELTMYLRGFAALITGLTLALAFGLLWRVFPRQRGLQLAGLPVLGLQTGLLYCALVLRTEIFSILLLLTGLLAYSLSAGRPRLAWLLAGLGFGLALLTKIQALLAAPFYLGACFYMAGMTGTSNDSPPTPAPVPSQASRLPWSFLALIPLLLLVILGWLSLGAAPLPGHGPSVIPLAALAAGELSLAGLLPHLKLQLLWLLLLATLPLSLLAVRMLKGRPAWLALRQALLNYPFWWCGLSIAWLLPLGTYLISSRPGLGWTYLLGLSQAAFWTDTQASSTEGVGAFSETLRFALATDKNLLLLALAVGLISVAQILARRRSQSPLQPGWLAALLVFGGGTLFMLLGSRAILRDTLWFGFIGTLSTLFLLQHSWQDPQLKRLLRGLLLLCLLWPALDRLLSLPRSLDQIYVNFAPFKSARYATLANAWFGGPDMAYPRLMRRAYGEGHAPGDRRTALEANQDRLRQAVAQARLLKPLHRIADLPFVNLRLPVRAMGLAEADFPAWERDGDWARFRALAAHLRGSVLVDPAQIDETPSPMRMLGMNDLAPIGERWIRASGGNTLSIYPGWETEVLICVSQADYQVLFGTDPLEGEAPVQITHQGRTIAYYPLRIGGDSEQSVLRTITGYTEFDRAELGRYRHPAFFLVRQGNLWGPAYPSWEQMQALR